MTGQGIDARSGETPQEVRSEGRKPGAEGVAPPTISPNMETSTVSMDISQRARDAAKQEACRFIRDAYAELGPIAPKQFSPEEQHALHMLTWYIEASLASHDERVNALTAERDSAQANREYWSERATTAEKRLSQAVELLRDWLAVGSSMTDRRAIRERARAFLASIDTQAGGGA